MTTTLNKIREHDPCKNGWKKLLKSLGKTKADDEELSLLTVLDSNGVQDAVWCFRAVDGFDDGVFAFARFCAWQNIEKIKPYTTDENYDLIVKWLETADEDIRSAARAAAWSAAESAAAAWSAAWSAAAAWAAAWSAAESAAAAWSATWSAAAAWSAAEAAAWSAAEAAAWSAARSAVAARSAAEAAARSAQEAELRRILEVQK